MALATDSLTVDYKELMAKPFPVRRNLATTGLADVLARDLTPSQKSNAFPKYYLDQAKSGAVTSTETDDTDEGVSRDINGNIISGNDRSSGRKTGGSLVAPDGSSKKVEKVVKQPEITASQQRAAEAANLGYTVDNAGKKEKDQKVSGKYNNENQRAAVLVNKMMAGGLSREASLSVVANNMQESGRDLDTTAEGDKSLSSSSYGIAQWRETRLDNLKDFAKSQDRDWTDIETQADFQLHEFNTLRPASKGRGNVPADKDRNFINALNNAKTEKERETILRDHYEVGIFASKHYNDNLEFLKSGQFNEEPVVVLSATTEPIDPMSVVQEVAADTPSAEVLVADQTPVDTDLIDENQKAVAAIRKGKLDDDVKLAYEYAASRNGVKVEVVSGGQMSIEEAKKLGAKKELNGKKWYMPDGTPVRTGSIRHDGGGAGDVKLYRENDKGERTYLSLNNKADRAVMASFVTDTTSAGMTGIGAGNGYMGPETLHVGKGKVATWGGEEAWLNKAMAEGMEKPVDVAAWNEERKKTAVAAKKEVDSLVEVSEADASNMPKDKPFSLAKNSAVDTMKQEKAKRDAATVEPEATPQAEVEPVPTVEPVVAPQALMAPPPPQVEEIKPVPTVEPVVAPQVPQEAPQAKAETAEVSAPEPEPPPQTAPEAVPEPPKVIPKPRPKPEPPEAVPVTTMAQGGVATSLMGETHEIIKKNSSDEITERIKVGEAGTGGETIKVNPETRDDSQGIMAKVGGNSKYEPEADQQENNQPQKNNQPQPQNQMSMRSRSVPSNPNDQTSIIGNVNWGSPTHRAAMLAARNPDSNRPNQRLTV